MRTSKPLVPLIMAMALLSACASTVKLDDAVVVEALPGHPAAPQNCCAEPRIPGPLDDLQGILSKRSIYFDYDGYTVKDEFRSLIEAHSRYLQAHKERKVFVEGNTDEQGGREYNLALGQKRADSVRIALKIFGVQEAQIEAITFGAEKPKAEGRTEAAFAENRRVDIVYP